MKTTEVGGTGGGWGDDEDDIDIDDDWSLMWDEKSLNLLDWK